MLCRAYFFEYMNIKEISRADVPVLRELAIRIFVDTFSESNTPENMNAFLESDYRVECFEQDFNDDSARHFFIVDNETPVGYLRVRKNSEADHYLGTNTMEIHRLYVDKRFHGRNAGALLMQHALDIAKVRQVDWVWLGVWEKNLRALRFYEKWGFERFSEHVFQMGDDAQIDWLLKKKIS